MSVVRLARLTKRVTGARLPSSQRSMQASAGRAQVLPVAGGASSGPRARSVEAGRSSETHPCGLHAEPGRHGGGRLQR
ncbi:MAG: hypothetical protein IPN17_08520 [Deltaproteobacteria bacterium]|nr:hypothetical protein [Deltaproteobacteria bacterium]